MDGVAAMLGSGVSISRPAKPGPDELMADDSGGEFYGFISLQLVAACLRVPAPADFHGSLGNPTTVFHHDLAVRIDAASQSLEGSDIVTVRGNGTKPFTFTLNPGARIHSVTHSERPLPYQFERGLLRVPQSALPPLANQEITIRYAASFRDPIPEEPIYSEDPTYGVAGVIVTAGAAPYGRFRMVPEASRKHCHIPHPGRRPQGDGGDHRGGNPQGEDWQATA